MAPATEKAIKLTAFSNYASTELLSSWTSVKITHRRGVKAEVGRILKLLPIKPDIPGQWIPLLSPGVLVRGLQRNRTDRTNKCNLFSWLTGCGLCGPVMAVSRQKGQGSGSCLVHKSGCLISPSLIWEFWRMPRELLGSIPHWNLGEIGYDTNGEVSQQRGS